MVSWTLNIIEGGSLLARANLNGGDQGKGPASSMEKSINYDARY